MVYKLGVFADLPYACTGFATVCKYLANYLTKFSDLRVIYFGRFGQEKEFAKETKMGDFMFEYVPCQGGVWNRELMVRIIKHYKLDVLFSEDDWFSTEGLTHGANFWKKPLHLLTPIDSLPIHPLAYEVFGKCAKIYIPNRSYKIINEHVKKFKGKKVRKKALVEAMYLPHGVDTRVFRPSPQLKRDRFTFVWIGRDDHRKALGRMISAFEKIQNKYDVDLLIRTDWNTPNARNTLRYIERKKIRVIRESLSNCPHGQLARTYNRGHVSVCTAKAGGFELQVIEAQACELPVLVTDWNFMNEHIINGKNGFKIPCESWETVDYNRMWGNISINSLSALMEWCVENAELVGHMGRWARNFVQQNYKWSEITKTLYRGIMNSITEEKD